MNKLYRYQERGIEKLVSLKGRGGNFSDVGTGKTRMTIETVTHLPDTPRRILVVAPLEAYGVWRQQVRLWAPMAKILDCTRGSIQHRAQKLKRVRLADHQKVRIYVIVGYESYWREPLRGEILKWKPEVIIYDEGHRLKSRGAKQSRFAHMLASAESKQYTPEHILVLTATPLPNGAEDAFSLFKSIDPKIFGSRWADFEDKYIKRGGYMGHQIIGYKDTEGFTAKLAEHSFRITKAEALDLPDQVDVEVPVRLSASARRIYDKLARDAIVEIDTAQGKGVAIGRIVLTNILRLQQVASGFVKVEDGRILDLDTAKQDVLSELLRDTLASEKRAVVFCRFRHDVEAAIAVSKRLVGDAVYRIDGTVDHRDREAQLAWFRTFDPAVLVGQIQVASLSIDLTCAHVGIFFSRDYSLLHFDQARGRLHRHGQKEKVTYYHLVASQTIDEKIFAALKTKDRLQKKLLDGRRARQFFDR